jgi:anti-sigma B factor antagonist
MRMNRENHGPAAFAVRIDNTSHGVRRVGVRGEIDISTNGVLSQALVGATVDGTPIVVDLTECTFIDSSGVRALLVGYEAYCERDGNQADAGFAIAAGERQIRYVLETTGLDRAIPLHESFAEAAGAVASG